MDRIVRVRKAVAPHNNPLLRGGANVPGGPVMRGYGSLACRIGFAIICAVSLMALSTKTISGATEPPQLFVTYENARMILGWPSYPPVERETCDSGPVSSSTGTLTYPPSLDVLPSGYRRAWFGNSDLPGHRIKVRFNLFGSNGLASQEQWP